MRSLRAFPACARGSAATEMALILPFLTVLLFGSIELGYYFYNEHQVVKGVRDGARYASRQSLASINCLSGSSVPTGIETAIKEVTRTGRVAGGSARVVGWVNDDVTVTVSCAGDSGTAVTTGIYQEEPDAPIINVSATVSYQSLFNSLGVIDSSYSLTAQQQSAVMGI